MAKLKRFHYLKVFLIDDFADPSLIRLNACSSEEWRGRVDST